MQHSVGEMAGPGVVAGKIMRDGHDYTTKELDAHVDELLAAQLK